MRDKMKIAITGHTSGLGLSIYNHFKQKSDCIVMGISRATGFDLTTDADKVVEHSWHKSSNNYISSACKYENKRK
jgi:dTDP-4-dehydrorhamnose reductase